MASILMDTVDFIDTLVTHINYETMALNVGMIIKKKLANTCDKDGIADIHLIS